MATDLDALAGDIHESDRGAAIISGNNNYTWYYAIGALLRPKRIAEFGVRYGYSTLAMGLGALHSGVSNLWIIGWDGEIDISGSTEIANARLERHGLLPNFFVANTDSPEILEEINRVSKPSSKKYDIVHVDADHSPAGIVRELGLALRLVNDTGVILVDDCGEPHIDAEVGRLVSAGKWQRLQLPSLTKLSVLYR